MELVLIVLLVIVITVLLVACWFLYEKVGGLVEENVELERRIEGLRAGLVATANGRDRLRGYLARKADKRG